MAKSKKSGQKLALGKGLDALFMQDTEVVSEKELLNTVNEIAIEQIEVNPFQPRIDFDEKRLQELAQSIRVHGVIQPITVRWLGHDKYQLIAGERRLRASKITGLDRIPAFIRTADDQQMLEIALIENIQREDLNPIEISLNYRRLIDECQLLHEQLAERVGKDRSTITNYLRLLKLPPEVQLSLKAAKLSMGHARALAGIEDIDMQLHAFKEVVNKELSVRKTEKLVKDLLSSKGIVRSKATELNIEHRKVQDELRSQLGAKVAIKLKQKGNGELVIPFSSTEDLNRILDIIQ